MSDKKIEIIGKTFNSKKEAREYYKADLKKRLPELKKIEGFPIGEDEYILALSDPPYYTACPNPYINEFIEKYGKPYDEETDDYHREPFVGDVSVGKNNPIYNVHSYHTKVPHPAIMKYIEHYTEKENIVLDAFSGTGMTGVAAQLTGRKAILSDLSPVATWISKNYNTPYDPFLFEREALEYLNKTIDNYGWVYKTKHKNGHFGIIENLVWSEVLRCPFCKNEYVFYESAVKNYKVYENYNCPNCGAEISKRKSEKIKISDIDNYSKVEYLKTKLIPVLIEYKYNGRKYVKKPDQFDHEIIEKIENINIPFWFPTNVIKNGDKTIEALRYGIRSANQFYTKRTLLILSAIFSECKKPILKLWFSSHLINLSILNRYRPGVSFPYNPFSGAIYIASQISEANVFTAYLNKVKRIKRALTLIKDVNIVSTCSATDLKLIKDNSIDYIFTDPPFGSNLMYSELNFIWESWLRIMTNTNDEAIINKTQNKSLDDYNYLLFKTFREYYRVLKPNRWITVEFHNSKSSVWNGIQEGIVKAGFVVANVAILDKQQGSYNQVSSSGATKSDLVISAYKPSKEFEEQFLKNAGEGLELDFIQEFLHQQPIRPILERTEKMLYSKMLSYYIQHGYEVLYDAKVFYQLLKDNFAEEDGYWFNAGQINSYIEYKKKMKLEGIDEIRQGAMMMFVTDEKSALVWLHNFLNEPKSFSDIHTAFTQLANIQGDEMPDLKDLLEQNFIAEKNLFRRPQTEPEHNSVIEKREKQLMRQFESILIQAQTEKKKIKSIRKEAVQLGFETCYKEKRFQDILTLANRLDKKILEENAELKEFVDAAEIMISGLR